MNELVNIPTYGEAKWRDNGDEREVVVERTNETNSVPGIISSMVEMDIGVKPIGQNLHQGSQLPVASRLCLCSQFWFKKSIDNFEGVLGQTYRPGYVSPVKRVAPMPMMGGEHQIKLYGPNYNV